MLKERQEILTVSELTRSLKTTLEETFPSVWVEGEVSNFTHHSSGHMYFTLKDANAQIQVVMFRHANRNLRFTIEEGMHLQVCGSISIYEKRGNYQIYADICEPKGIGALKLAFEQLKKKLQDEGLFDEAHKKQLPILPRCIGVVTSPTGAAIRDIIHVIDRRFPNIRILLSPVKVQGEGAAREISAAIKDMNTYGEAEVLIVGRGGGSLEDLWPFNEEEVARAIYASRIPIISAVGHEIDFTISDFVADKRAATPSAAAEIVINPKKDWQEKIDSYRELLRAQLYELINDYRNRLKALCDHYALQQPVVLVKQCMQRVDELMRQHERAIRLRLERARRNFHALTDKLDVLSPWGVLSRGYSVTYKKETKSVISGIKDVKVGEMLTTRFEQGSLDSQITKVNEK